MQKVETTRHIVDPFHTDYKKQLSWETLGVDLLNAAEAPVKMIIDGQLFILRGEKMYNANGQLVK